MKIYTDTPEGCTVIQNSFIDQYMPHANGEFVKVYLYLLRCSNSGRELSLSSIADVFEHTEKDVQRALIYWEKQRLIRIQRKPDGEFESVTFTDPGFYSAPVIIANELEETADLYSDGMTAYQGEKEWPSRNERKGRKVSEQGHGFGTELKKKSGSDERNELEKRDESERKSEAEAQEPVLGQLSQSAQLDLRELFLVAEQYLQRPLSASEQNDFVYYYHTLKFSTDLIEYLLEYCITRGTVSRYYMRKVAQGWAEAGITTVQEAKKESNLYNKNYFSIMKAFGLKGRNPAPPEQEMMTRWLNEYGFTIDIILEACRRTINQTHEPNFQYADKILEQWHNENIHTMKDIEAADQKWEREQAAKKKAGKNAQGSPRTGAPNRFNNFQQRDYNYDNLEKKLFGQQ
ncbi:MAG: DnaD domain protein [Lachnospiraceae bacterium]|nr:DnaD domain protein [Lachnospiraceae bacterium]